MRITLFGAGFAGSAIAAELAARGHQLTVVVRTTAFTPPTSVLLARGSVHDADAVERATTGADVIVSALPPLDDDGGLPASTTALVAAAGAARSRLLVVGSSAVLPVTPAGPRSADLAGFPDWLAPRVEAHQRTLDLLQDTAELDWCYLAVATDFGPHTPGVRTGRYRTDTEALVFDPGGRSAIGVADYALALADEVERPTVHRGWLAVGY